MEKERLYLLLTIIFTIFTFVGIACILMTNGRMGPIYALIPCAFAMLFIDNADNGGNNKNSRANRFLKK